MTENENATPAESTAAETTTEQTEQETVTEKPKRVRKGTISYAVNLKTLEIRAYKGYPAFDEAADEVAVIEREHMSRIPTPVLVQLYNKIRPEKPIQKFRDRKAAETTMYPVLEVLGGIPLPGAAKTMPAAAKKSGRKTATKKATKKESNGAAGRTSAFAGKKITKLVKDNPRREKTHGWKSFELIRNGMSYEAYLEAGGRRNDLAWDVEHKFVEVK